MTFPVALITGAAKRIGKTTACHLHNAGYNVIIHCHKSVKDAEKLVEQLNQKRSNSAHLLIADLLELNQLDTIAQQAVNYYGRLDLLINNASTFYPTDVENASFEQWDDLMTTNLKAPFFLIKSLQQQLETNKGCVINMVDIHADRPLLGYPIYCMAKAGLAMLTKSLSRELAPNIRVNGIAPGAILWHENELAEEDKVTVLNEIALNRLGSPDDIAEAILYLARAHYVTGQILAVDGGRSVNGGAKA
ncbi:pteridine reductase [Psychrosphaera sp. B3R10]|uniref:pteridine reductase n=1 Tax=unclassified Psychrosphaera TaxID=2641570 RepID=UPI001C0A2C7D|nr:MULTISPECIES: pteridine reductase [unclassified Psychrosphaera]MBU2882272.1 pteridine reductase [Psychrosphaera sp. I2R16]MBU2988953.1 pteridine reductase [Psychrosphaera sp. B3R10]